MENITQILAKYDTDKETFHRYGSTYETLFKNFDRNAILNILEVGTQKGGSLLAWKEYFPNANVYGVDVIDVVPDEYRTDTVTRIISDIKDWKSDMEWDIVIDDGSHYLLDIAYVFGIYALKLRPEGVLIIEDVRFPSLLLRVIENLIDDFPIFAPDFKQSPLNQGVGLNIKTHDTSSPDSPGSFIISVAKERL